MRSFSARGNTLYRVLGGLALVLLLVWAVRLCTKSDEERIAESIDAAREALHSGDDEAFLAWFTDGVEYQSGAGLQGLRSDLARWRSQARLRAFIEEPRIVVLGDTAEAELDVRVGLNMIQTFPAHADLGFVKEGDLWRVSRVTWGRGPRPGSR